jgi:cyclase
MRVIARLDIKGLNVIKTIRTEGLRVMGDPVTLAQKYYDAGVDEIIYMDVVASLYERNLDFEQLKAVSKNIFVPLTVGGGIRSVNDISMALHAGADKVAINTYALRHPEFLEEAVERFGAQCIVLAVDAKKKDEKSWEAYTDGGREKTNVDAEEWIERAIARGVGEIALTSVDRDGTRTGYDLELIQAVARKASVPVIAHAGAGSIEDVYEAVQAGADAICLSSLLHYDETTIPEIKSYLTQKGITVRL